MSVNDDGLPAAGSTVAGKYEVAGVLGRGGMGVVLEAKHVRLGRPVAMKVLLPHLRAQAEITLRFEREARNASRLTGPNAARVLDVDVLPDGSPFMVMELLQGTELGQELARRGRLPIEEAIGYVLQACMAMEEAHAIGIVHRDLKPSNLFLAEQGRLRTVKVLDFGISKSTAEGSTALTATQTAFGTPQYMSPEQVRSARNVDGRADIWSLGVILYELLTGTPPFEGPTPTAVLAAIIADSPRPIRQHLPELPAALAAAIMKTLNKDPEARFPDVRSFAAAIAPFGPSDAVTVWGSLAEAPRAGSHSAAQEAETLVFLPTSPRTPSRHGVIALIAALGLLAGAGAVALALTLRAPRETHVVVPTVADPGPEAAGTAHVATPASPSSASVEVAPGPTLAPAPDDAAAAPATSSRLPTSRTAKPVATPATATAPHPAPASTPAPTLDPKYL